MKQVLKFAALTFMAIAACTPRSADPDPTPGEVIGESVILPAESGSSVNVSFNFSAGWMVSNNNEWFTVSPASGFSGDAELTFTANEANTELRERVGYFEIHVEGEDPVGYYAIQKGAKGLELISSDELAVNGKAGKFSFEVLTNDEITTDFDQDWAGVSNVEYGVETTVLDDGKTVSDLQKARITLDLQENSAASSRSGVLELSCAGKSYKVTILQGIKSDASEVSDWTKAFYRQSLAMRFTATWCPNCPTMADALKKAMEQYPDRIVPMTIHGSDSDIKSENGDQLMKVFNIKYYPTGLVNTVAEVGNYSNVNYTIKGFTELAKEAVELLPSKTAIAAASAVSDNKLSLFFSLATKEALPYSLHVYLLENGIVQYQSSGGSDYVHDHVVRCALTGLGGAAIQGTENGETNYVLEYDIPASKFKNLDNAYVLAYVTYVPEEQFKGEVTYATYKDNGIIVDNVVTLPLNGNIDYRYEE